MSTHRPLRIAMLTHSTNPRGGVVHALEVADAMTRAGQAVTVFAPDVTGGGFFRPTFCKTCCIPVEAAVANVAAMVEQRVREYLRYLATIDCDAFDVWHAQDGISGNVLATQKTKGGIRRFVRTVHHIDAFVDPQLMKLQQRAIESADHLLTVSELWRERLWQAYRRRAAIVGNGVDTTRFSPAKDETDSRLAAELGLAREGPVYLAVGGVEARKNTLRILEAFKLVRAEQPTARLVIAGGTSLLDHRSYQARFAAVLADSDLPPGAVIRTGPIAQELMPALYRAATALVFPSVAEGFGLVVLEAMASGTPVIVSRIAPFTEYLAAEDALWCTPDAPDSIAVAMQAATHEGLRARLEERGFVRAAALDWGRVAAAHVAQYAAIGELCDA